VGGLQHYGHQRLVPVCCFLLRLPTNIYFGCAPPFSQDANSVKEQRRIGEAKIVLVGEGDVGKTFIVKQLLSIQKLMGQYDIKKRLKTRCFAFKFVPLIIETSVCLKP
jgi:hypothetical protein